MRPPPGGAAAGGGPLVILHRGRRRGEQRRPVRHVSGAGRHGRGPRRRPPVLGQPVRRAGAGLPDAPRPVPRRLTDGGRRGRARPGPGQRGRLLGEPGDRAARPPGRGGDVRLRRGARAGPGQPRPCRDRPHGPARTQLQGRRQAHRVHNGPSGRPGRRGGDAGLDAAAARARRRGDRRTGRRGDGRRGDARPAGRRRVGPGPTPPPRRPGDPRAGPTGHDRGRADPDAMAWNPAASALKYAFMPGRPAGGQTS